jgi:hypothetical protein
MYRDYDFDLIRAEQFGCPMNPEDRWQMTDFWRFLVVAAITMSVTVLAAHDAVAGSDDDTTIEGWRTLNDLTFGEIRDQVAAKKLLVAFDAKNANNRVQVFQVPLGQPMSATFVDQIVFDKESMQRHRVKTSDELNYIIESLGLVCRLMEAQYRSLELAGSADQKHFYDRVQVLRAGFASADEITAELSAELNDLRQLRENGLYGPSSFFTKVLEKRLSEEQLNACRQQSYERLIPKILEDFEARVRLQPSEEAKLVKLIKQEIPAPCSCWVTSHKHVTFQVQEMEYQLAAIAQEKLKPLLSDIQWRALEKLLAEFRSCDENYRRDRLRDNKLLKIEVRAIPGNAR